MNPFFLWTELWLKSGRAMLESLQRPAGEAPAPRKKARKARVKAKAKKTRRKARR